MNENILHKLSNKKNERFRKEQVGLSAVSYVAGLCILNRSGVTFETDDWTVTLACRRPWIVLRSSTQFHCETRC